MHEVDWKRVSFFAIAVSIGLVSAIYGQPYIQGNEKVIDIITQVFSILSGFLVAIMAIMGDPTLLGSRSWRGAEVNRSIVVNRLVRQKWLFYLYLSTLILVFAYTLLKKQFPCAAVWLERTYLGIGSTAFILSLGLPSALMKIQLARHDELIEAKRKSAGIASGKTS